MKNMTKLRMPTNQMKDTIFEDMLGYFRKAPEIEFLNIGNNHFKGETLARFLRFAIISMPALTSLDLSFTTFETSASTKCLFDILKDNKKIKTLNLTGCNLELIDIEYLNTLLTKCDKNALTQVKACMNRFTEEQLSERFRESQSSTDSSDEDQPMKASSVSEIIQRPIESFFMGLFKSFKMYW